MRHQILKRAGLVTLIAGALMAGAHSSDAATISKTRLAEVRSGEGALYATVNGKERLIEQGVTGAWIIENGDALVYATITSSEFANGFLTRYDPNARTKAGEIKLLMGGPIMVENVRSVRGTSGKTGLLVSGTLDGSGSPAVAIVDSKRGRVWHHLNARVTGVRNGRLAIATYLPGVGSELPKKPLRMLYPMIDELLSRAENPLP